MATTSVLFGIGRGKGQNIHGISDSVNIKNDEILVRPEEDEVLQRSDESTLSSTLQGVAPPSSTSSSQPQYASLLQESCRLQANSWSKTPKEWTSRGLSSFVNSTCGLFWEGDSSSSSSSSMKDTRFANNTRTMTTPRRQRQQNVHVVVAYCNRPLNWIPRYLGTSFIHTHNVTMTIYSKCGDDHALILSYFPDEWTNGGDDDDGLVSFQIETLDNVGGCDHTYAHWMATKAFLSHNNETHDDNDDDHVVLFLKDTPLKKRNARGSYYIRPIQDVLRIVSLQGFSCGLRMNQIRPLVRDRKHYVLSTYFDSTQLQQFTLHSYDRVSSSATTSVQEEAANQQLIAEANNNSHDSETTSNSAAFESKWDTMGDWVRDTIGVEEYPPWPIVVTANDTRRTTSSSAHNNTEDYNNDNDDDEQQQQNHLFPSSSVPVLVCLRGWFATTKQQIQSHPQRMYQNIVSSLSRGNNIEEAHFAERIWGGLFTKPLTTLEEDVIREFGTDVLGEGFFARALG